METTQKRSTFGKKGLPIVILCFFYWYLYAAITSDGLNTLLVYFMDAFSCDQATLSFYVTVGGWLTIVANLAFGYWGGKYGAKKIIIAGLIGNIIGLLFLANATSIYLYAVGTIVYTVSTCAVSGIGLGMLGSNWFPKKKGLFMGWCTMGIAISGATAASTLSVLINIGGLAFCMYVYVALVVLILIGTIIFVKDNPEEAGAYPDNDPSMTMEDVAELNWKTEEYRKTSPWTYKKILTSGFFWHMVIGWTLSCVAAYGLVSQLALAYISFGHDVTYFLLTMACAMPFGLFTSWLGGFIDNKKGTKAATFFCLGLMLASQLLMVLLGTSLPFMIIGTALLAGAMSAQNNTIMSITQSKFGRFDFLNGWTLMSVFQKFFNTTGLLIVAAIASAMNNYKLSIAFCEGITLISMVFVATFNDTCVGRNTLD
ncbi:MAG: MFS transporter [Lachnospiraceae bacterium]|nr:MFS transporter [Lachnospiraceae bacterium]